MDMSHESGLDSLIETVAPTKVLTVQCCSKASKGVNIKSYPSSEAVFLVRSFCACFSPIAIFPEAAFSFAGRLWRVMAAMTAEGKSMITSSSLLLPAMDRLILPLSRFNTFCHSVIVNPVRFRGRWLVLAAS